MSTVFIKALKALVDPNCLIEDPGVAGPMLVDERDQFSGKALAIVAPNTVAQLAAVVKLCWKNNIPVVPQGGNTGYCGGATPDSSGTQLLLSLKNLNKLRDVDVDGHTMTVEAGMILSDVQLAASENNLLFPLSMGSEGSCQIGGNLSTNAGGLAVLRYGTARELVLGLEVVTPQGDVLSELKTLRKDTTGYDLKQLYIGAEGTLGVITAASLKLFPLPTVRLVCWVAVPEINGLAILLRALQSQIGDAVSSFEYVSNASLALVLEHMDGTRNPLSGGYQHHALIEFSGFGEQTRFEEQCTDALATAQTNDLILDAVLASSHTQAQAFWYLRESIPRAEKHIGGSIKHDVSVPISKIGALIVEASAAIVKLDPHARLSVYGHVGDGNVHFNVLPPSGVSLPVYKQQLGREISTAVHGAAAEFNGSFSAEHGVGQLKTGDLENYSSALRLSLMKDIKSALDPRGLMNPGKVLHR